MSAVFQGRGAMLTRAAFAVLLVSCGQLPAPMPADSGAIAYRVMGQGDATVAFQPNRYPLDGLAPGEGSALPILGARVPLAAADDATLHITIGAPNHVSGRVTVDPEGRVTIALTASLGEVPNDGKVVYSVEVKNLKDEAVWSDAGSRDLCHFGCASVIDEVIHKQVPADKLAYAARVSMVVGLEDRPIGSPPPSPFAAPWTTGAP